MNNLLNNWKTTSAGLTIMIGSAVHLIFAVRNHTADETTWTNALIAMVGGMGLVYAGDASATNPADKAPVETPTPNPGTITKPQ